MPAAPACRPTSNSVFKAGEAKLVVEIGPDFAQGLEGRAQVALIADASDPNVANIVGLLRVADDREVGGTRPHEAVPALVIHVEHRLHYNPEMKSVFLFVPGVLTIVLMLVSAMLTSISIAREKEYGSMEVMLVSPLRPILIIAGRPCPTCCSPWSTPRSCFIVGRLLFHVPMEGSYLLLGLEGCSSS
jgi:ABC-2 type transport system permease protein